MHTLSRRRTLLLGLVATVAGPADAAATGARGIEGQRKPDQGNGAYLNPIMAGDRSSTYTIPGACRPFPLRPRSMAKRSGQSNSENPVGSGRMARQTLLDPLEWAADGWFVAKGGDLSRPLPKPTATTATS